MNFGCKKAPKLKTRGKEEKIIVITKNAVKYYFVLPGTRNQLLNWRWSPPGAVVGEYD